MKIGKRYAQKLEKDLSTPQKKVAPEEKPASSEEEKPISENGYPTDTIKHLKEYSTKQWEDTKNIAEERIREIGKIITKTHRLKNKFENRTLKLEQKINGLEKELTGHTDKVKLCDKEKKYLEKVYNQKINKYETRERSRKFSRIGIAGITGLIMALTYSAVNHNKINELYQRVFNTQSAKPVAQEVIKTKNEHLLDKAVETESREDSYRFPLSTPIKSSTKPEQTNIKEKIDPYYIAIDENGIITAIGKEAKKILEYDWNQNGRGDLLEDAKSIDEILGKNYAQAFEKKIVQGIDENIRYNVNKRCEFIPHLKNKRVVMHVTQENPKGGHLIQFKEKYTTKR